MKKIFESFTDYINENSKFETKLVNKIISAIKKSGGSGFKWVEANSLKELENDMDKWGYSAMYQSALDQVVASLNKAETELYKQLL